MVPALPVWGLSAGLAVYAVALWRAPSLFLLAVPIIVPLLDFSLWAGWSSISEADLFVLVSLAVLVARVPAAFTRPGWSSWFWLMFAVVLLVATVIGLLSPLGDTGQSANPYLRPDNALRLAKSFFEALALYPFVRQRQRVHGDAALRLGCGIAMGLIAVTVVVLVERALFAGILDFHTDYRVAGPFSSMHVGGGHIGAYTALALPFAVALIMVRGHHKLVPVLGAEATVAGGYTVLVTFARTGYAAAALGCAATGLGLLLALWRRGGLARVMAVLPVALVLAGVGAAASIGVMRDRLAIAATDLLTREANWRDGWAVRDPDLATSLFGMGLGTYQRTMLARASVNRPSDFGLGRDAEGPFAWVRMESPFYLGQKITVPEQGAVHLSLRFRAGTPNAALNVSLCDKVLLYSDNCQAGHFAPRVMGDWEAVRLDLPIADLGSGFGPVRRPVELSLYGAAIGSWFAVRDVRLTDDAGRSLIENGDFTRGMARWLFTDDSHVSWRILNQYLMLLFETGLAGLIAWLALAGAAVAGGTRAALRGDPMGSAVAGSVLSFLVSGLFDNVLEAPRLAALFFLVCLSGLMTLERRPD